MPLFSKKSDQDPEKKSGSSSVEEEFKNAFHEYSDALFRHALYRISDRERAIDVVQDTFMKVWSYVRSGKEVQTYKPFLYRVMNNLIVDEYRRKKESSLDALFEEDGIDEGTFRELHSGSVEELTFMLDAKKAIELLHILPPEYKETIIFRYIDGLGPKEISEIMGETENTVSVRIYRGLRILKKTIKEREEEIRKKRTLQ